MLTLNININVKKTFNIILNLKDIYINVHNSLLDYVDIKIVHRNNYITSKQIKFILMFIFCY